MDLTIIIPNYNNANLLKELLESIQKIINVKYHIIIVDNGSTDNSIQTIQKYPNINLIKNKENKGFAYAVNQAIKETKTDYVLLLNNDVVIKEDTAEILLKTIKEDPNIFAVSSKIIQYHNRNLLDDAGDEYNILGWSKRTGYNQNIEKYNTFREIFSACAAASIYNKNILCQIGLFDEKFFAYVEDMDVCFRAKINGYKCLYNPNAIAYHHGSATTKSRYNPFKVKISARNNIYLIYKNMPYWMIIINT